MNLVLNPEFMARQGAIDENDFFNRSYLPTIVNEAIVSSEQTKMQNTSEDNTDEEDKGLNSKPTENLQEQISEEAYPTIRIEVVLVDLNSEDQDEFRENLVPWVEDDAVVIESSEAGQDPFQNAVPGIRVVFEGWYDPEEDDFDCKTFFLRHEQMTREDCQTLTRVQKRKIGFLIYRDFRALTWPITLDPSRLFGRLISSQDVKPRHFQEALSALRTALEPMTQDDDFISLLNSYKSELERFLILSESRPSALNFQVTDGTRTSIKSEAQLYVRDLVELPIQKSGAGTRSLAILSMLTLIMRRRGRGILALEEPETFLFPHAQRRVIDECLSLASQTFITTHSPYVLERIPVDGIGRIERDASGNVRWSRLPAGTVKVINLFSKRLRQACCEALLGRGVVVVEGDSDKWWILGVSRILNRQEWKGRRQEALELLGVSVVSADTNGDVIRLADFFNNAGIQVVAVFDHLDDADPIWGDVPKLTYPCFFLRESGLERLLSKKLPLNILQQLLYSAQYSKSELLDQSQVMVMDTEEIRTKAFEMLCANKGSAAMHEWILSLLDVTTLPDIFKDLIDILSQHLAGKERFGTLSLVG
jgi:putative ATP-dependent endonuclease of OLD family